MLFFLLNVALAFRISSIGNTSGVFLVPKLLAMYELQLSQSFLDFFSPLASLQVKQAWSNIFIVAYLILTLSCNEADALILELTFKPQSNFKDIFQ